MHIIRIHVLVQIEYMEHVIGIAGCGYVLHDFSVYRPYFSKINAYKIMNHDKKNARSCMINRQVFMT